MSRTVRGREERKILTKTRRQRQLSDRNRIIAQRPTRDAPAHTSHARANRVT